MEKLMRKLNNESGKSIFMALLLLLVAVVVSVVIVTVAVTSVMHVQDNKTSQQEYLACASAANLIKDCVAGSEYEKVYTEWVANDSYTKYIDEIEDTSTSEKWTTNKTPKDMKSFAEKIVEAILNGTTNLSGKFTISINNNTENNVTVDYKLITGEPKTDSERTGTTVTTYSLKFKLSAKHDENSNEYRMTMVVPITKKVTQNIEKNLNESCKTGKHTETKGWGFLSYTQKASHDFTVKSTTTTITWQNAKGTGIAITKGWDEYDNE